MFAVEKVKCCKNGCRKSWNQEYFATESVSQDCLHLILFITILLQSNITNVFKVDKYIINTVTHHHHVDHGVGDSVHKGCCDSIS